MDLIVKSRNGKISERQRQHIEQKLSRLDRYLDRIAQVTVEHMEETRRDEGNVHRVQVTVVGDHGVLVRAERRAPELYAAIDEVYDTLQRQIERYKDKHWRRGKLRRQGGQIVEALPELAASSLDDTQEEENRPRIVRTKEFQVKPMYSDEAVEQMELLGHNFFIFQDAETGKLNVLYRRQDGNYGLIVPEVSG
ncbi:MAG: ribosome-associated translation inhibitor RaiA [Roseiflexus sp.]|jgi:ribosomal subunit interface protein|nr:ribosome-associated translation inhibitor RaiA [Roseiflexus sp.]MBO9333550.1 ribosome-associated translation inhibitor RaiA [Roseiflexus sp.]MBO9363349.1 ribosome-associated translation inhibitor RaiA [Roseiflexus sp.]MBO9380993.1 ribosome-associated translation inhibitor RaiA [Roseiflexus sp.]MBO9387856.1 ribosome-associated translation inhibitor RaiA [Roseiflexus sp.]